MEIIGQHITHSLNSGNNAIHIDNAVGIEFRTPLQERPVFHVVHKGGLD